MSPLALIKPSINLFLKDKIVSAKSMALERESEVQLPSKELNQRDEESKPVIEKEDKIVT